MRENKVKALWRENKTVACAWCSTVDPYIVETMANAGFDVLVIDMQHGMAIGPDRAAIAIQIINSTPTVPMVRVPWNDPIPMQYVLDAGAMGVIVPMVNNKAEAQRAAGAVRYPPVGYRSNGANRAMFMFGSDYGQHANQEIICLCMIETQEGIENLREIGNVPGVDGFYIGPSDLGFSLGLPRPSLDMKEPVHVAAVQKVVDTAKEMGLAAGIHCTGTEEVLRRYRQGFNFCNLGSDAGWVSRSAAAALETLRKA